MLYMIVGVGGRVGSDKTSRTARYSTEGPRFIQSGYPRTDLCSGFSLFRFRPDAFPPFLGNLASSASADDPMLTQTLRRT